MRLSADALEAALERSLRRRNLRLVDVYKVGAFGSEDLKHICEQFVDLDELFQTWLYTHYQMVRRIIGVDRSIKALDGLPTGVNAICLRSWPPEFPDDIAAQLRSPYEARADAIMYRQIMADAATARGWKVLLFNVKDVEQRAAAVLGPRADEVLHGPRQRLGPPWTKDHRTALAATVVCG